MRLLVALALLSLPALAHEVRPAYLELREAGSDRWDVLFKVPGRGEDKRLRLRVKLPDDCVRTSPKKTSYTGAAFVDRFTIRSEGGLAGASITIEGLSTTMTDVLARVEHADGSTQIVRITPTTPSFTVEEAPGRFQVARTYLDLGIEHIVLGVDHLLFVLTLLLLIGRRGWRPLVGTITAFTIAHSLTLAAASLGTLRLPQQPVEAVIALSILFVAAEILRPQTPPTLARRSPWLIAFLFGLLHGLGFAGALTEIGLPHNAVPLALLFFNVGVEVGQLLFVAGVLAIVAVAGRAGARRAPRLRLATVYTIGAFASFWLIERVVAFA